MNIQLRSLVTNGTGRLEDLIDMSLLKFRDRDDLEDSFKRYKHTYAYDMRGYRDHRLRGYYEDRFDHRGPLADWDYHECVKPRASIIHIKQFKEWRLNGIAFEFGDQTYTEPNRTMMSFTEGTMKVMYYFEVIYIRIHL